MGIRRILFRGLVPSGLMYRTFRPAEECVPRLDIGTAERSLSMGPLTKRPFSFRRAITLAGSLSPRQPSKCPAAISEINGPSF